MNLIGQKVKIFRCHVDPNIPPKTRNAFMIGKGMDQLNAEAYVVEQGVWIKLNFSDTSTKIEGRTFLIPWTNLENVELFPESEETIKLSKSEVRRRIVPITS